MDCDTPLEKIIDRCREVGIDCIAVADHGTAEGALKLKATAPFKVIVAEEILTPYGEIMGMFLKETVPSNIPADEAIERIKAQGGLVNIPHPFETVRSSAMSYRHVEEIADRIDAIEVLNSRSPLATTSHQAKEFALKHDIARGAGSDAHTIHEIGRAYVEMPDFETPQEFLQSLRQGRIMVGRSSLAMRLFSTWAKVKNQFLSRG